MYEALKKIGQRLIGMVVRNQLRGIRDCLRVGRPRYFMPLTPLFAFHSFLFQISPFLLFSFTCFSFFTIYSLLRASSPHPYILYTYIHTLFSPACSIIFESNGDILLHYTTSLHNSLLMI